MHVGSIATPKNITKLKIFCISKLLRGIKLRLNVRFKKIGKILFLFFEPFLKNYIKNNYIRIILKNQPRIFKK